MEWLWTKEKEWWDKWDLFNNSTARGHYLQLSDWLFSYHIFGFETELLVGLENNEICLGYGIIKVKYLLFKFYIINNGPIIREGYESYLEEAIQFFLDKSKKDKAFYCHMCLPVLEEGTLPFALSRSSLPNNSLYFTGKMGMLYKIVFSLGGLLWVNLDYVNEEERLADFNIKTRRDIRASQRKGLVMIEAQTNDQVEEAYHCIALNAKAKGFSVRPWKEFKQYLLDSYKKGFIIFLMAYKDNECKGAMMLLKVNEKYTYVMGGYKREKPDLLAGYFLQWEATKMLMQKGVKGYDISLGGSKGVMDFKLSFGPIAYTYVQYRYWVLSPLKHTIYSRFYPFLVKNRKIIVRLMKSASKIVKP